MTTNRFDIIVACANNGAIGYKGNIPWQIKEDLLHFRDLTTNAPVGMVNAVIMGRKTWYSLPHAPLKNRMNIVITTQQHDIQGANVAPSFQAALDMAYHTPNMHRVYVIGGARVYEEGLKHPDCKEVHVTHVYQDVAEADTLFPLDLLTTHYQLSQKSDRGEFAFCTYVKNDVNC
jgi:dihydrofolate reductase